MADRWHLLKNVREAVERLFERRYKAIQEPLKAAMNVAAAPLELPSTTRTAPPTLPDSMPRPLTAREQAREAKRERRVELFDRVHELHQAGQSIRQIAVTLDLARETVTHYLHKESFPDRKPGRSQREQTSGYRDYVDRRLSEGCHNAAELHRELTAKGFDVSYYAVRRFVRRRVIATGRQHQLDNRASAPVPKAPSAKELSFTVIRKPEERDVEEQTRIGVLGQVDAEISMALELAAEFAAMIRNTLTQSLAEWLEKAEGCASPEMRGFAQGLRQDAAAVQAGMTEPWSNGPVEGHVNRLKMIKRQMYGRAGFELLRARVVSAA